VRPGRIAARISLLLLFLSETVQHSTCIKIVTPPRYFRCSRRLFGRLVYCAKKNARVVGNVREGSGSIVSGYTPFEVFADLWSSPPRRLKERTSYAIEITPSAVSVCVCGVFADEYRRVVVVVVSRGREGLHITFRLGLSAEIGFIHILPVQFSTHSSDRSINTSACERRRRKDREIVFSRQRNRILSTPDDYRRGVIIRIVSPSRGRILFLKNVRTPRVEYCFVCSSWPPQRARLKRVRARVVQTSKSPFSCVRARARSRNTCISASSS